MLGEVFMWFFRWLFSPFKWGLVRSFGELQILTRASYVMLIVVPMLAGTWPAVRIVITADFD
jgi:hypothetical protein